MNLVHVHLFLTHVPVLGTVFGLLLLIAALARHSDDVRRAAFATFVACALVAVPTYLTGEAAEDAVEDLPGVTDALIERHEDLGGWALALVVTLGVVGLTGSLAERRAPRVVRASAYAAAVVGLVTAGVMAVAANTGGAIRHTEIHDRAGAARPAGGENGEHR
jgi:hypothetical protein